MPEVANRQIAAFLEELALLMELSGENPFRIRAHARAARAIERLEQDAVELVARDGLTGIRGIGPGLAGLIAEFVRTGTALDYEKLKSAVPAGLLDMLRVPGLGPRKVRAVHQELGIDTLDGLEEACRPGTLGGLSGFGKKTQENILLGIEQVRRYRGWHRVDGAWEAADALRAALAAHPHVDRVSAAGDLRRCTEIVGSIPLLAGSRRPAEVAAAFSGHSLASEVISLDPDRAAIRLRSGLRADLFLVDDSQFGATLHHLTGSAAHRTQMRDRARQRGLQLEEQHLLRGGAAIPCADEEDLFAAVDLDYIPPELREGLGEVEAAERGELPVLVEAGDIRGMLHVHTTYSDGEASLEEMATAVRKRGFSYLGVADHSRSAAYARGLSEEDVRRQHAEIDELNERLADFRLFKGIESDILADGALDYDDRLLASFDFVIVSVHSRFQMGAADMTRRLVRAIEHPACTILGHLTGRLLLEREGYPLDVDTVLEAAARCRVAVEINADPSRLDIDWRHLRKARDLGVGIAVNTDAHTIAGLDHLRYGLGVARKGWLRPGDVINTMDATAIAAYFRAARRGCPPAPA